MNKLYRQCRKGFRALEFPCSEGGETLLCTRYGEKYYIRKLVCVCGLWEYFGNFQKSMYGQRKGEYRSRKLGKIERNMVK